MLDNEFEEREKLLIEDNCNVSDENPLMKLFTLAAAVCIVCFFVYFFAGALSDIFITLMPDKTQLKVENMLGVFVNINDKKYTKTDMFDDIKKKIISEDKRLSGKSNFPVYITKDKEVNAYIYPNGTIFVTRGLLDKVKNKASLDFVIAHEIAHYAHRDHLRSIGKELTGGIIMFVLTGGNTNDTKIIEAVKQADGLAHSRRQEINADKYAAKIIKEKYGNIEGARELFELFDKEYKLPEFASYLLSHPAPKSRIRYIEKN